MATRHPAIVMRHPHHDSNLSRVNGLAVAHNVKRQGLIRTAILGQKPFVGFGGDVQIRRRTDGCPGDALRVTNWYAEHLLTSRDVIAVLMTHQRVSLLHTAIMLSMLFVIHLFFVSHPMLHMRFITHLFFVSHAVLMAGLMMATTVVHPSRIHNAEHRIALR